MGIFDKSNYIVNTGIIEQFFQCTTKMILLAKMISRPSAQPVSTQWCVHACVYRHKADVSAYSCAYACVVSSLCPVYFSSPATLHLPSTTLAIPSQPTHTGRESVDQWSRIPTGTVVELIAPIAAVMNATSVHSLQRTTPNPLSCPGLTPCVSLQSARTILRSPVPTTLVWTRLTTVASQLASHSLGYVNNCT